MIFHKRLFNSSTFYIATLLNEDKIFFEKNKKIKFLIENITHKYLINRVLCIHYN